MSDKFISCLFARLANLKYKANCHWKWGKKKPADCSAGFSVQFNRTGVVKDYQESYQQQVEIIKLVHGKNLYS